MSLLKNINRQISVKLLLVAALLLSVAPLFDGVADAAQMPKRRIEISTAQPSTAFNADIAFQIPSGTVVTGIELEFADSPLGSYASLPSNTPAVGGSPTVSLMDGSTSGTLSGTNGTMTNGDTCRAWSDTGAFSATRQNGDGYTGGGTPNNQIQLTRTSSTTETADSSTDVHCLRVSGTLTHNASGNTTFFVRVRVYSSGTSTLAHDGVVAASTASILTVSARVQEILQFCVNNTTVDDSVTSPGDCGSITGTTGNSVDIGVADNSTTGAVSPDPEGNSRNGIVLIRSNALNGSVIGYKAVQQTGTNYVGALRISGATCTSTGSGRNDTLDAVNRVSTDQCFNSATTKTALTASVEQFGMTGRYINRASSGTPTANLSLDTEYDSTSTIGYAWVQDGTFTELASSTGSTDKVLDDESVILKFAAVAALTTPTGVYSAQADFIAISTY
jgi:hypothetical protein